MINKIYSYPIYQNRHQKQITNKSQPAFGLTTLSIGVKSIKKLKPIGIHNKEEYRLLDGINTLILSHRFQFNPKNSTKAWYEFEHNGSILQATKDGMHFRLFPCGKKGGIVYYFRRSSKKDPASVTDAYKDFSINIKNAVKQSLFPRKRPWKSLYTPQQAMRTQIS